MRSTPADSPNHRRRGGLRGTVGVDRAPRGADDELGDPGGPRRHLG